MSVTERMLIEQLPIALFSIDINHEVVAWNRACEALTGIAAADMIGTRNQWQAFYPHERPLLCDLSLARAQAREIGRQDRATPPRPMGGDALEVETFFPLLPNGGRWLWVAAAPIRADDGQLSGAIQVCVDITAHGRAMARRPTHQAPLTAITEVDPIPALSIHAESQRLLAEEKYKTLFTEMINGFALHEIILDDAGHAIDYRFLAVNPAFEAMTGQPASAVVGRRALEILPSNEPFWIERYGRVALTGEPDSFESYSVAFDKHFEVRAFRPAPGQFAAIFEDVTVRKQAETRLKLLARVFEDTQEGIVVTDPDSVIVEVNDAFVRITGYERTELIGQTPRILRSGRHGPEFYNAMRREVNEKGWWRGEIWNRRKDGEIFPEQLTISVVLDKDDRPSHYVGVAVDISAIKRHQAELDRAAHYDALTGLPNRVLLRDRLEQAVFKATQERTLLAVCFLDIDRFKPINETHGHAAGDHLLIELAGRFSDELRGNDTVVRLDGDEFSILLTDLKDQTHCIQVLKRILAMVRRPFEIGGHSVSVTASIGVTLCPTRSTDVDILMRQADQAMYQSKQMGEDSFVFYDGDQDAVAVEFLKILEHIGNALSENEFVLHYQPKVNMRTGKVVGAEALIRWQHPERGLLPPGEFLPAIEGNDLIVALGDWVLREALRQCEAWEREGLSIPISINISARHLQSADFVERLKQHLQQAQRRRTDGLEIEITETTAINDLRHITQLIEACRALGVHCALDDFGTGYSSLTYLKLLPVSTLKIDKSFVAGMAHDAEDHAIVSGVIGLANAFNLTVIAEGVETTEHGLLLLALGCELAQGYGIAPPMPADRFPAWAKTWKPDRAWVQNAVSAASKTR